MALNRTATFVFYLGPRHFGSLTAYVIGPNAASYRFTSALPVQILKSMAPVLLPHLESEPELACAPVDDLALPAPAVPVPDDATTADRVAPRESETLDGEALHDEDGLREDDSSLPVNGDDTAPPADYEAPEPDPPTLAPEGDEGVTAAPGLTDAADYEPTRLRVGRIGGAELSAAPQSAGLAPSGSAPVPAPAGSAGRLQRGG